MKLELKTVSYEDCKEAHKSVNAVFESQICALTKAGEGACHVSGCDNIKLLLTLCNNKLVHLTI